MIPYRTPAILPLLFPACTWRIKDSPKTLFLTFDDGPIAGPTEFVLEQLRRREALATFFCIGDNIRKHPTVMKRIVAEGHAVANHTYHHLNGWKTPSDEYFKDVEMCESELNVHRPDSTKGKPLFRPPYGRFPLNIFSKLKGWNVVMWDVLTHDYNKSVSPEVCLKRTIASTRDGSIIVFHDSIKAERNMQFVLPRLMDHFKEKGFLFKALHL